MLEVSNFQSDVLDASLAKPVLVDFWAPWCGPCRTLGPVLEKLAGDNAGAWTLAKVNTDENPQVARQYGIMSIPAVKLFVDGAVVDEFVGALPEASVRQWLDKALPSEDKLKLAEARGALEAGRVEEAQAILADLLAGEPANSDALVLMARARVFTDPEAALTLMTGAAAVTPDQIQTREAILTIARLSTILMHQEALPLAPGLDDYVAAVTALSSRDFETALVHFIDVVRKDRTLDDDGARRACLALFTLLGEQHDLTRKYRRTLQMALF